MSPYWNMGRDVNPGKLFAMEEFTLYWVYGFCNKTNTYKGYPEEDEKEDKA
jgi:hypothetical protein